MEYGVEMGSGAMIYFYISSFVKTGSGARKLRGSQSHRQHGGLISLLLFFKLRKLGEKLVMSQCRTGSYVAR
jgi:hypothetical protein